MNSPSAPGGGGKETFGITVWAIGHHHFLEITGTEADTLRSATRTLVDAVGIEQKLDLLISNLMEFERELADRALTLMHRGLQSTHDLLDDRLAFARRLLNLLSSARTYVDHVKHHVSRMHPGDKSVEAAVTGAFAERYDATFAYRLMEALRNYAQHRGMPIHGFGYDRRWVGQGPDRRIETNVRLSLDAPTLASEGGFKAAVLQELQAMPHGLDLKQAVREYVEALGSVHAVIREIVDAEVTAATATLSKWRGKYAESIGATEAPVGLAIVRRERDQSGEHLGGLAETPIGYLAALRARTSHTTGISKQALSLRSIQPRKA